MPHRTNVNFGERSAANLYFTLSPGGNLEEGVGMISAFLWDKDSWIRLTFHLLPVLHGANEDVGPAADSYHRTAKNKIKIKPCIQMLGGGVFWGFIMDSPYITDSIYIPKLFLIRICQLLRPHLLLPNPFPLSTPRYLVLLPCVTSRRWQIFAILSISWNWTARPDSGMKKCGENVVVCQFAVQHGLDVLLQIIALQHAES